MTEKIITKNTIEEIKIKNKTNLLLKNTIYGHDSVVVCVSIFPSGNIVSVSYDKTIKIYDNDFNILQCIQEGHDDKIIFVDIKDDNYFEACSLDKSIKTWIKKENEFELYNHIKNAHKNYISKIIYSSYWIYNFEKVIRTCWNAINRVYKDRIIIGGKDSLFVI